MYKNVGRQIKKFAKVIYGCEIVFGGLLAFIEFVQVSRYDVELALFSAL